MTTTTGRYLECTVVHTGYHPLRNGDPFLPPTAPIGTGTDTSTSRYQTTSLLASGASTELLLEQSTWVARARGRATFEGSFRRHEAGCRFVHFCEQTFAPHSVVSAFLRRLVLFASHPPNPIKVTLLGYICVECMFHVYILLTACTA